MRLRHSGRCAGRDPSSQKAKANTPLGTYARQYLDSLAGTVDPTTIEGYEKLYRTHIGPVFGSKPVASITTADVPGFRAQLLARTSATRAKRASLPTVTRSPKTVKHIVGTLSAYLTPRRTIKPLPPTLWLQDAAHHQTPCHRRQGTL